MKADNTIQIQGVIFKSQWGGYGFSPTTKELFEAAEYRNGDTFVCLHAIDIAVPADFCETHARLDALSRQKEKVTREFQQAMACIQDEVSKLQAIEFKPTKGTA